MGDDPALYPVALVVAGRPCLVVGGGAVAGRKIAGLLRCGAHVTVVAPEAHRAMAVLASDGALEAVGDHPLDLQLRPYRPGEAARYRLVLAATGVPEVDGAVHDDAEAAGVWVNCADDSAHCSFMLPAVHRDGPVTVAVSTSGSSPALAAWLRSQIAAAVGPGIGALAAMFDGAAAVWPSGGCPRPRWTGARCSTDPSSRWCARAGSARPGAWSTRPWSGPGTSGRCAFVVIDRARTC